MTSNTQAPGSSRQVTMEKFFQPSLTRRSKPQPDENLSSTVRKKRSTFPNFTESSSLTSPKKKQKLSKPASSSQNQNKQITDVLMKMAVTEKNMGNAVKFNAYLRAVNAIKTHPHPLKSGSEAMQLPGVGKKIAQKIQEILETGKLDSLERRLEEPRMRALDNLCSIPGIGPVMAKNLYEQNGVDSIDSLREAVSKGKIHLNHQQQMGLKYYEGLKERIPRQECTRALEYIRSLCQQEDSRYRVQLVGSYRRGAATCGDIDILLTHERYSQAKHARKEHMNLITSVVELLKAKQFIVDDISHGPLKYMGICYVPKETSRHLASDTVDKTHAASDEMDRKKDSESEQDTNAQEGAAEGRQKVDHGKGMPEQAETSLPRHIDIKLVPYESMPCALLYFTGSGEFNREMRTKALAMGYSLNEYSLRPVSETGEKLAPVAVQTEKDVFDLLGMEYLEPEKRNW